MMNEKIVEVARACLGTKEGSPEHITIVDIYNQYRGNDKPAYKMTMQDPWCATFVSSVFIAAGASPKIPIECSCFRMKNNAAKRGILRDKARYVPKPGDVVFYKMNKSSIVNHTGIIASVDGSALEVIEGNYKNSVGIRKTKLSYQCIDSYIEVK